jgi:HK97 family phage major capsid protein
MSKAAEMREKRGLVWDKAKAFLDERRDESGMLSAEDTAAYEAMEREVVDMGHAIEREERAIELEREMNAPVNAALTSRPEKDAVRKSGRASDEYRQAFWNMARNRDLHFSVQNSLTIGADTEGGYLCPDDFERTLIQALEDENVLRPLCSIIRTSSGDRKIPVVVSHGEASWVDEEGEIPESDEVFGQLSIGAHKVATMIKVSDELLQDSVFDIERYIAVEFARRVGAAEEESFLTGDGTAKPLGMLSGTGGAGVGVTTAGTTLTADELIDLVHSLRSVYRRKAVVLLNDSTIKTIRKLKDGQSQYLWQPGLKEGQPDMLLNYRLITSSFMPEIGAGNKVILFGDYKYYWIADRQGRSFQRLNELYARTGQVGFRATQRVDGRLVLPEALKCLQVKA